MRLATAAKRCESRSLAALWPRRDLFLRFVHRPPRNRRGVKSSRHGESGHRAATHCMPQISCGADS